MAVDGKHADRNPKFTPVCALGASAGGIAALKSFFSHVQNDLGLAYVVVVHLSPDHPSSLSEILASQTKMPVEQVDDTAELKPNHVYVIPPNRELAISGNDVTARPFTETRGRRSPIDMVFESVAAGRGDGFVVLLSGTGSDGTLGVRAVKEAGGFVFVQEPSEAEYSMMPENAIASGGVDFVAPIAHLVARLAEVVHDKNAMRIETEEDADQQIRQIINYVRRRTGHDFSNYKRATMMRRLARRMQLTKQSSFSDYYKFMQGAKSEAYNLFADLLISVTSFFRDSEAFSALATKVVAPLFNKGDGELSIRVWVVGCATGEEAYSIGILLLEEAAARGLHPTIQIFASDIDDLSLAIAREGRYPKSIEANVSDARLRRFFIREDGHYRVKKELRDLVLFAAHSVLKDPPFIKIDLISCRNLLIYLQRNLQRQLGELFYYALRSPGYIFLGSAETLDTAHSSFDPVDRDARIYVARAHTGKIVPSLPQLALDVELMERRTAQVAHINQAVGTGHGHAVALEKSAPPSALVDSSSRILHLSQNASSFFKAPEGPFSPVLPTQVRPELRVDLKIALQRALEKGEASLSVPIPVAFNGDAHLVALHVTPAHDGDQATVAQALVFFLDLGKAPPVEETTESADASQAELKRLRQELAAAQDRLAAGRTEYEQATQDLRAANEELQSMNEEYRSTAEELETSKEELQSINEELQTVNSELKSKLDTISTAHSDLQNLVASTDIGTLFLDRNLNIRFFTPRIRDYFNIGASDLGRLVSDFSHRLHYDKLEQDVSSVLTSLVPVDKDIKTNDGTWLSMQVRPYRTVEDEINGVVVTFTDITELKQTEQDLAFELRASTRLQQLSTKVMEADKPERPLGAILDAAMDLVGAEFGRIQLYDDSHQVLRLVAHHGFSNDYAEAHLTTDASSGTTCGIALTKCERVVFEDVEKEPTYAPFLHEAKEAGYRAVASAPLCSTSGKFVGMLSLHFKNPHQFSPAELRLIDITARQAADAISVYSLQQDLREADRRKDEFLAILAHELRNPLAPIHNAMHVLLRSKKNVAPKEVDRLHALIERQSSHLIHLVDDLLDVARITQGKIVMRRKPTDLRGAIRQAIETTTPLMESKRQQIKVSLPEEPLKVDGDVLRLSQVFTNLLSNSSKFTQEEGLIEIAVRQDGNNAISFVRDNGVGFSPENLLHAFDLFYQVDEPLGGKNHGIGVGLALVQGLVHLHGGKIEAFSAGAGQGSEFRVTLPLTTDPLRDDEEQPRTRANAKRVLVVDDQKDVSEGLASLVRSLGVEVQTALDGRTALRAISDFKPSVAIIDIGMPDMDGIQLAVEIRKLPAGKDILLVAHSGWSQDDVRERALKAGFDRFFVKPISVEALGELLALEKL